MEAFIGTSGYQYAQWSETFYPGDLKEQQYLRFYGQHLKSVEINNTFYRLPREQVIQAWAGEVPQDFRFSIKASQRITHHRLLGTDSIGELEYLLANTALLGPRLGALFFQTPRSFRPDFKRLEDFLHLFAPNVPAVFEFRNDRWRQEKTYELLGNHNYAWCIADTDQKKADIISTADWGYIRLRRSGYTEEQMRRWIDLIHEQAWKRVFVFFKHSAQSSLSPVLAQQFSRFWKETEETGQKDMVGYHG